jgi:transposase/DNA invertase Pin-like site-specific DNA recombinase
MKAAIYARVSTERQAERGTTGSQVQALRAHLAAAGDELAAEYRDDGHSGARLDRPGLDALRDAAEAGLFEVAYCLSPDRLARSYAYQMLILDELARLGVAVRFTDAPGLDQDDPQARLLTQVQGVIAEYERAKIGERYRRGKLFRSRAGEVISRKAPYGYRRIPRGPGGPAHLEIFEPEAAVVRRIFAARAAGTTIRQICRQLNADAVPTPAGRRAVWGPSTINRLLRNEAYIGRVYYNRTEIVADRRPGRRSRQVPRPRADWIAIPCPAIIAEDIFEAAAKVSYDNAKWSPRRAEPGAWLLRGLVKCGPCGVGTSCHKMRGRNGTWHRYYYCHNHDPVRAGGQDRRCPERNIRADTLDEFVFGQVRAALLDPAVLLAGEQAIAVHAPVPDDQLLAAELARLDRRLEAARSEHNRLIDLYQAGLIDMPALRRRAAAITARQRGTEQKRASLEAERADLARGNRLRQGVQHFAGRVRAVIDELDPAQRQALLRLLIEDVQVTGWHVKIRLRIPLDEPPGDDHPRSRTSQPGPAPSGNDTPTVSAEDRLRSLHGRQGVQLPQVKNDERDCTDLADLLRMGKLPEAWIAPPQIRGLREVTRYRHKLAGQRTSCQDQVHAVLAKSGIAVTRSDIFGPGGGIWLDGLPLPQPYAGKVASLRALIAVLDGEIARLEEQAAAMLAGDRGYAAIRQLPGIGPVLGAVIAAEIGDITRFGKPGQLCSWAGLTPRHYESGTRVIRGHVSRQGSRMLRWALVEAIQRQPAGTRPREARDAIMARRGDQARGIAKTAAARILLTQVFYGMRDGHIRRASSRPA